MIETLVIILCDNSMTKSHKLKSISPPNPKRPRKIIFYSLEKLSDLDIMTPNSLKLKNKSRVSTGVCHRLREKVFLKVMKDL
jgi:hypothetical protein